MSDKEYKPGQNDPAKQHFLDASLEELTRIGHDEDTAFLNQMDGLLDEVDLDAKVKNSKITKMPRRARRARQNTILWVCGAGAALLFVGLFTIQHFSNDVNLAGVDHSESDSIEISKPETAPLEEVHVTEETTPVSPILLAENGEHRGSKVTGNLADDNRDDLFIPRTTALDGISNKTESLKSGEVANHASNGNPLSGDLNVNHSLANRDHLFTKHFLGGAENLRGFEYPELKPTQPQKGNTVTDQHGTTYLMDVLPPISQGLKMSARTTVHITRSNFAPLKIDKQNRYHIETNPTISKPSTSPRYHFRWEDSGKDFLGRERLVAGVSLGEFGNSPGNVSTGYDTNFVYEGTRSNRPRPQANPIPAEQLGAGGYDIVRGFSQRLIGSDSSYLADKDLVTIESGKKTDTLIFGAGFSSASGKAKKNSETNYLFPEIAAIKRSTPNINTVTSGNLETGVTTIDSTLEPPSQANKRRYSYYLRSAPTKDQLSDFTFTTRVGTANKSLSKRDATPNNTAFLGFAGVSTNPNWGDPISSASAVVLPADTLMNSPAESKASDSSSLFEVATKPQTTAPQASVFGRVEGKKSPGLAFGTTDLTLVPHGKIATVNGKAITRQQLDEAMKTRVQVYLMKNQGKVSATEAKRDIRQIEQTAFADLVDETLILGEFKKMGGNVPPKYIDDSVERFVKERFSGDQDKFLETLAKNNLSIEAFRKIQENQIAIQASRSKQLSQPSPGLPAERNQIYSELVSASGNPDKVKLRMISIPKVTTDSDTAKQEKLVKTLQSEIKNGASFDDLAKKHSQDSFAPKGGLVGVVSGSTLNGKIAEKAFALGEKEVSDVIDDGPSWRLLFVDKKIKGKVPSEKELAKDIDKRLAEKNYNNWINHLRKEAKIELVEPPKPKPAPPAERYGQLVDNPFASPLKDPLSTFSVDVDTASYSNIRRLINEGHTVPADSVRIEEMINYFSYDYPQPEGKHPFAFAIETAQCPWNEDHQLMRVGIQGKKMNRDQRPPANLVFLLDVSGSMRPENKLPLVRKSMGLLIEELTEHDTISIVVYAGAEGLCLPPTAGNQKKKILDTLNNLRSGGSTNGGAGIQLAYKLARENFKKDGINRVILCTDGDFNVGKIKQGELVNLVEKRAQDGTFLSVLGFGSGNINDSMLEAITNKGNGNYFYIDSIKEGRKVLLQDLMSTLVTIAKDVKIQIEFNPKHVQHYRLIGYANRILKPEDFTNDKVDAGEIGAGHSVTALYEIVPAGAPPIQKLMSSLRYQEPLVPDPPKMKLIESDELCTLKLRYKLPDGDKSIPMEQAVNYKTREWQDASDDYQFSSAVALWGMLLRNSEFSGQGNLKQVLELAEDGKGADPFGRRAEFMQLLKRKTGL